MGKRGEEGKKEEGEREGKKTVTRDNKTRVSRRRFSRIMTFFSLKGKNAGIPIPPAHAVRNEE
jgi:hypothetical protein